MNNGINVNFNQSELFISLRSPFARRVRLAFLENKIDYKETVCDVFKPSAELVAANPLVRVPTLRLVSGEVLIDSNLILQAFYESLAQANLMPSSLVSRLPVYRWQAIAAGFAEKTVEYFIDSQRPQVSRDPELEEELKAISVRVLAEVETTLIANPNHTFILGNSLTQADLDLVCALTYFGLRYSREWKKHYPRTSLYLDRLEKRPSFVQTYPPA